MQAHQEQDESDAPEALEASARAGRRWRGAAMAVGCAAVVGVCLWLRPSESGVGTHEQLGGSPCGFLIREGIPCPGCGVTTAMAAAAHGRLALAVKAQAGGFVLLAAAVAMGLGGAVQALSGRHALKWFALHRWGWWLIAALAVVLAGWGLKLAAGYASGEFPLH